MGAQVVRFCGEDAKNLYPDSLEFLQDPQELVLRVVHAPIDDPRGAHLTDYKVGAELKVVELLTLNGFDALGWRYREKTRQQWPASYRFQVAKRCWQVRVTPDDHSGPDQVCLLQMSASPDARTLDHAKLDVDDAQTAAVYAQRFNLHQQQYVSGALGPEAPAGEATDPLAVNVVSPEDGAMPTIKVAAPVACEVIFSGYPSMVPVGAVCTLTPYAEKDVQKFVFDGHSDEFLELPQAFFHYAAFSSGGKEYVCDIQGAEDDDGSFLIVDPCMLKSNLPTVRDLIGVAVNGQIQGEFSSSGPTAERFDALHPKCCQACKAFDPHRRSALRNGKAGMCGMGTCGMTFARCGR